MTEYSYDVTHPENGVQTLQAGPTNKSTKIICFLIIILLFLIGVIIFLVYFNPRCDILGENQELRRKYVENTTLKKITTKNIQSTTETMPSIDMRWMEMATKTTAKIDDDWEMMTCKSSECAHTAAHMLDSMDFTVEPCENFYDFACGRMEIPRETNLDIFAAKNFNKNSTKFLKKFKTFYDSCLNHENKFDYETRINRTRILLERVGSFKIDGSGTSNFNLTQFIANMILYNSMPLFDIDIDTQNQTYVMKLLMPDQTSLKFDHWSAMAETRRKCLRDTGKFSHEKAMNMTLLYNYFLLCQKNYADYLDSISTSIRELGFFSNLDEKDAFTHIRNIRIFIEFQILSRFDEIPLPPNIQEEYVKRNYENIKIEELEKKFPLIEWEILFELVSNRSVNKETVIQMYNKDYFEDVFKEITAVKSVNLNNALLAILATSLYENTVLPSHKHDRTNHCQKRVKELMPDVVNYLYKENLEIESLNKSNAKVEKIFEYLQEIFVKSLENQKWLDDTSRGSIKSKLERIQLVMLDKDDLDSDLKYLDDVYGNLEVEENNYQLNHFNLIEFRKRSLLSLYGQNVTKKNMYRSFVDAASEQPLFFYANNILCIPYGLVRKVIDELPEYMILAQVGFPLAKVIGQAFDRIGINYGLNLSESAKNSYSYFADQTRDMLVLMNPIDFGKKELYFNLNNDLSESERISDNTAMRIMTETFSSFENQPLLPWISRKFSKEGLFFLHLAQGLCRNMNVMDFMVEAYESPILPPQFRIKNILGNSKAFLKIFACRPGSGMSGIEERFQFPYLPANVDDTL